MSSPEGSSILFRRPAADIRPRALAIYIRRLQTSLANGRAFECLLTGDAELRKLNREFRGKDEPTDVLSFPAPPAKGAPLGSLAISLARARAQAREFGHDAETEVRILILHGLLHLLGYDHETDAGRMRRAEARWRAALALPAALIERVAQASRPAQQPLRSTSSRQPGKLHDRVRP